MKIWLQEIDRYGDPDVYQLLLGNKSDLASSRTVNIATGKVHTHHCCSSMSMHDQPRCQAFLEIYHHCCNRTVENEVISNLGFAKLDSQNFQEPNFFHQVGSIVVMETHFQDMFSQTHKGLLTSLFVVSTACRTNMLSQKYMQVQSVGNFDCPSSVSPYMGITVWGSQSGYTTTLLPVTS